MPGRKLKEFLDQQGVKYVTITHSPAYSANEIAASAHIKGKELAKTVIVKLDGKMAMAVLPSSDRVDFELLKRAAGATQVELADEREFRDLFPDCELGAMPPFGNLYDMEVLASKRLAEDEEIAFNAGSHDQLIRLGYGDFERLVRPKTVELSKLGG
ncbi:MAG: deacylase [Gemmatimonadetes bacterium RIFCSPLOWO2_12_FULL_68_9]|nr:MAG: deacylase [Gemmatimonadetes bacterium RIFCSPLOWO2_12_FULL_68_9]